MPPALPAVWLCIRLLTLVAYFEGQCHHHSVGYMSHMVASGVKRVGWGGMGWARPMMHAAAPAIVIVIVIAGTSRRNASRVCYLSSMPHHQNILFEHV